MSAITSARIQVKRDTTEHWNNAIGFIPLAGEIIVYEDYETKTYTTQEYGEPVNKTINIPNIKIGTGNAYVQDLAFVDEVTRDILIEHIHNQDVHVTLQEKVFWNNKVNIDDTQDYISGELKNETLIINRN